MGRRTTRHSGAVLTVASLLALAAIVLIVTAVSRASAGRDAEVVVAEMSAELNSLERMTSPGFVAPAGSTIPQSMAQSKQRIVRALAGLRDDSDMASLRAAGDRLPRNFATVDRLATLVERGKVDRAADAGNASGASPPPAGRPGSGNPGGSPPPELFRLFAVVSADSVAINRLLDDAAIGFRTNAANDLRMATLGSAGVIILLFGAFAYFFRRSLQARDENERLLAASREDALVDSLTGLGNRRALSVALAEQVPRAGQGSRLALALFDLDGFKQYNDTFGHPAGDALLMRLGDRLATTLAGIGTAYRMGGDEFTILAEVDDDGGEAVARMGAAALSDDGEGFSISCSFGLAMLPEEAQTADEALLVADQRMYAQKSSGRASAGRQSADVLVRVAGERHSGLLEHVGDVAAMAQEIAERLGLNESEVQRIRLGGELHDIGKTAIPDAILDKPGPLDEDEWAFMRRHTKIGERIMLTAPSLAHAADLVRCTHERMDGQGYPDGLAGDDVPLGSRIIAVCDAYAAMRAARPYRAARTDEEALAEIERCSGTQFDPEVVAVLRELVREQSHVGNARG